MQSQPLLFNVRRKKRKTLIALYTWLILVCLTHGIKFISNFYILWTACKDSIEPDGILANITGPSALLYAVQGFERMSLSQLSRDPTPLSTTHQAASVLPSPKLPGSQRRLLNPVLNHQFVQMFPTYF